MTDKIDRSEAVISLWPEFAEAIVTGKKTVEFRRRIALPVETGRLWIYSTKPVQAILGYARIRQIVTGTPHDLWSHYGEQAFLTEKQYKAYFENSDKATAFLLYDNQTISPISLTELRNIRPRFYPPQSLTWLSPEETSRLEAMGDH
ncbi:MAG: ASCH domain-containing protein [Zymomonas mobilis subsp. pomaceae]|uniref:ASCH domain-containing protein n=1 Tax=Zymomonas mobilis subsp. pomaceae (strain ATCC 29192 / DSM 22645 / JCM 10191 / CCUG 17912 / NBRC 13757 / NCIMB 11200 / NRRL B-4491 / Barker I) TaxID=579138 RepID=F8EUW1_ZYMMT|nr:ASCH domain-containing protein [Zymomonas mobilis]AEI37249.1 protein of unknown function DUF437 [Zymomonas mobilis subsp. pomaceae ATCC 29192]MDX5948618.1 ASCH domain-containing protein [Zymomonas mobilis subsp. pomaceae]GEB88424.1 hypothetical protein ZMO02_00610 [Zymomonas mobilis subsp. pomaceae]